MSKYLQIFDIIFVNMIKIAFFWTGFEKMLCSKGLNNSSELSVAILAPAFVIR